MVLFSPPFREISTFTRPGARWNEDAVGGGGSFLYVLDGATSLDAAPVMDPVSDAAWLVRETARWLDRHLPEASRPLEDILAQGMARLLDQWSGPRAALPSAGVAMREKLRPRLAASSSMRARMWEMISRPSTWAFSLSP